MAVELVSVDDLELSDDEVEESAPRTVPGQKQYGWCEICGEKANWHRSLRCANHPRTKGSKSTSQRARSTGRKTKTEVDKGVTSFFAKGIVVITMLFAMWWVQRKRIPDAQGAIATELAASDEEAKIFGQLVSKFYVGTKLGGRTAGKLAEYSDVWDIAFVLIDGIQRRRKLIADLTRAPRAMEAEIVPIRQETTDNEHGGTSTEDRPGDIGAGGRIFA